MQPHQDRVIAERHELGSKALALGLFIGDSAAFSNVAHMEQARLREQLEIMKLYLDVLDRRISAFEGT